MKYGSVCSGIEAASVAWEPLGWEPVFFSEIEPFPCSVLAHHWPKVPNHGDMTRYAEWGYRPGSVDVLVGGTPCQSFSVAGLRGGLDDARGNLALVFARMVDHLRPRWVIWENVPGVLSSNGGRDFASILGSFSELGYSCVWRILDAQYFGVPQRRRRVFLVASAGDWRGPAAVLFEPESVRGDSKAGKKAKKELARCLTSRAGSSGGFDLETETAIIGFRDDATLKFGVDIQPTLTRNMDKQAQGITWPVTIAPTLNAAFGKKLGLENQHALGGAGLFVPAPIFATSGQANAAFASDVALTLNAMNEAPYVSQPELGVRRLTPTECERLQGFPDGHTLVEHRGKIAADGPRYKAIGNSMAVPVMRWIGQRISKIDGMIRR